MHPFRVVFLKIKQLFRKTVEFVAPPLQWRLPVIFSIGMLTGLGILIIDISNAPSYLSDSPETCMNCHVMAPQFATWQRGSHGRVSVCNDCHVPHNNFIRKYLFKASDGLRHSFMFTFHLEPQVIQVKDAGMKVIQENCIRCHSPLVQSVSLKTVTLVKAQHGEGKLCWECHRETPHGRVNGLASVPYARVPVLSPVLPKWIEKLLFENSNSRF
jgi:cytochrome c nitrite reductase small subunit